MQDIAIAFSSPGPPQGYAPQPCVCEAWSGTSTGNTTAHRTGSLRDPYHHWLS